MRRARHGTRSSRPWPAANGGAQAGGMRAGAGRPGTGPVRRQGGPRARPAVSGGALRTLNLHQLLQRLLITLRRATQQGVRLRRHWLKQFKQFQVTHAHALARTLPPVLPPQRRVQGAHARHTTPPHHTMGSLETASDDELAFAHPRPAKRHRPDARPPAAACVPTMLLLLLLCLCHHHAALPPPRAMHCQPVCRHLHISPRARCAAPRPTVRAPSRWCGSMTSWCVVR